MTVAELIAELQKLPPHVEVMVYSDEETGFVAVDEVDLSVLYKDKFGAHKYPGFLKVSETDLIEVVVLA